MDSIEQRLSKLEGLQHAQFALLAALTSTLADAPGLKAHLDRCFEIHHALLLAESRNEVKLRAFQELAAEVLGTSAQPPS